MEIDMDWLLIVKILGPIVVTIAIFVEFYKLKIRKGKFEPHEVWILAGVLSVVLTVVAYLSFDLPGSPVAMLYYSILVYAVQFVVNMKVLKAITKEWAKRKGFKLEEYEWDE